MVYFKQNGASFDVLYHSGANCGSLYMEVDGFYVWWPNERPGFIGSDFLHAIADKLDELNKEWQEKIDSDPTINDRSCSDECF